MKKFIEQMKMKKLAKKIAGLTLGAVALGAMSVSPVYAAEEGKLSGGTLESSTVYTGTGAVTISGASTGTSLANNMMIYGKKDTTSSSVTGSVTASGFESTGVTGLIITGGQSSVAGVKAINNKVLWESSAIVGSINQIRGFVGETAGGISAEGTEVKVAVATVANDGEVYGDHVTATETATATGTIVTLTDTNIGVRGEVYGANVKSTGGDATATDTTLKLTNTEIGNDGKIYGAAVTAAGTATATGTNLTLDNTTTKYSPYQTYGAYVISSSGDATATDTTATLTDTTVVIQDFAGAHVEGKTSATATDTKVKLTGGSVNGDFYGVYVLATDVAKATGTTLTINGAILDCKSYGALVKGNADAEAKDTDITITGGEIHELFNAAEVKANEAGSKGQANNTKLIIDGTKIVSTAAHIQGAEVSANAGGEILSAKSTTVKLQKLTEDDTVGDLTGVSIHSDTGHIAAASATADTTEVEMTGGNVQDVVGVKINHVETIKTENKTSVTLNNVAAQSVTGVHVIDGSSDKPISTMTATMINTAVTLNDATVAGAVKGVNVADLGNGYIAKTVEATGTTVTLKNVADNSQGDGVSVIGANIRATETAKADITTVDITGITSGGLSEVTGVNITEGNAAAVAETATAKTTKVKVANAHVIHAIKGVHISADQAYEAKTAEATGTTVELTDTAAGSDVIGANIIGQESAKTDITEVKINVEEHKDVSHIGGDVIGAYVKANGVLIKDTDARTGGEAETKTTTLTVKDTYIGGVVYGAKVEGNEKATATGTTVTLEKVNGFDPLDPSKKVSLNSLIGADIKAKTATADITKLDVTGSLIENVTGVNITGDYGQGAIDVETATAKTTNVKITDAQVTGVIKGVNIAADHADEAKTAEATGTYVTLTDTDVVDNLFGANIIGQKSATATDTEVKINIKESDKAKHIGADVIGANVNALGVPGKDDNLTEGIAEAKTTTLTIDGTEFGGAAIGAQVEGNKSASATTTDVEITNSVFTGKEQTDPPALIGAWVEANADDGEATATGTTVTLEHVGDKEEAGVPSLVGADIKAKKTATADVTNVKITESAIANVTGVDITEKVQDATVAAETATATGTSVELTGTDVEEDVVGANIIGQKSATAIGTKVTLDKETKVGEAVTGAYVFGKEKSTAKETQVYIDDSHVTGAEGLFGLGYSIIGADVGRYSDTTGTEEAEAKDTMLIINDSTLGNHVYGAYVYSWEKSTANDTDVTISDSTVVGEGGIEKDGVIFDRALTGAYVGDIGRRTDYAKANNTSLTIESTELYGHVTGAAVYGKIKAVANDTDVTITDHSAVTGEFIGAAVGLTHDVIQAAKTDEAEANNTTVIIKETTFASDVTGAHVEANKSAKADTTVVDITGGIIGGTLGRDIAPNPNLVGAEVHGNGKDGETTATATGTIVMLTDTEVAGNVYGAAAHEAKSATIEDTTITLNNSFIGGNVTGAYADEVGSVKAANTKIIFEGAGSTVAGIVTGDMVNKTPAKGAALEINTTGNIVGNLAGFDMVTFDVPEGMKPGEENAFITITDETAETDLRGEIVHVMAETDEKLAKGDKIYLVNKTGSGALHIDAALLDEKVIFSEHAFEAAIAGYNQGKDRNDLILEIEELGDTPETLDNKKSVAETIAASMGLLNSGADFLTDQAMGDAKTAAKDGEEESKRYMRPFVSIGGSSLKYKSGSHIDAKGWNGAIGFAKAQGDLTFGVAVEHGQANYDSYVNAAHGEGKNKYTGGVIFAEVRKKSGTHFDASFRAGRAESDYQANLMNMGVAHDTRFDTSGTYLGFSMGVGKEMKVSDKGVFDVYGRYYFNHLGNSSTTTNSGIGIEFKNSDSSRLRLGTRFTQQMSDRNKLYAGLAWQYEFSGKARAVVNGFDAPAPTLKGHSAMLELGLKTRVGKNLDIDFGLNGWMGRQRGIAGNLGFKWMF